MRFTALVLLLACTVLAAAEEPAKETVLASVKLPPELDRVLRDYEAAWQAGDEQKLAALFAEDGFVLASTKPPVRGRDAIRVAYSDSGGGPLSLRALAYETEGEVGYIIGAYGPGPGEDTGKFVLALRRVGGRWLITADIDNSSRRPRPQP